MKPEDMLHPPVADLSAHLAGDANSKRPRTDPKADTGEMNLWTGATHDSDEDIPGSNTSDQFWANFSRG